LGPFFIFFCFLFFKKLDKLTKEERIRQKRLRKKANEKRQKNVLRMQLNMFTPTDIALDHLSALSGNGEDFSDLTEDDESAVCKMILVYSSCFTR
jgi:AdoMet-dependent rRNA methyltransferase SPB1